MSRRPRRHVAQAVKLRDAPKEALLLELNLLGTPELRIDATAPEISPFGKELALLYYLATTGQPQTRTSLAVLLWGDLSDAAARGNLRKALSTLREQFDPWLIVERDVVGLALDKVDCDVRRFEQLAHEGLSTGQAGLLQSAIDLYRGDFLTGVLVRNAPDYDLWLNQTQDRLRGIGVRLLDSLADHHQQHGAYNLAIACLHRVLEMESWREETHRRLMTVLAASGQRSAALHQYEACVDALAAELGVEPSAETTELHKRIRNGQFSTAVSVQQAVALSSTRPLRPSLPAELTPIIGRERELSELAELLATPSCRLISILGPGGIGKTRLALALAHRHQAEFDIVARQSLAGMESAAELLPAVTRALGIDAPAASAVDALRQFDGRILLLLDEFERLLPDGLTALETVLSAAQHMVCVVTSRETLGVAWEWRYELQELTYPTSGADQDRLTEYGAVQLFMQLARRTRARHAISRQELPFVAEICRLVGGMPLGVEMAAAQVGRLPCELIARELASGLHALDAFQHATPNTLTPRQRSLVASFAASWNALSAEEQRVLAELAVLRGEFTLDAALAIAETTVTNVLRLVDKSLIRLAGADRYALHAVVRQLAEDKLAERPPAYAATVLARYRRHYVTLFDGPSQALLAQITTTLDLYGLLLSIRAHLQYFWQRTSTAQDAEDIAPALAIVDVVLTMFGWKRDAVDADRQAPAPAITNAELAAWTFEVLGTVDTLEGLAHSQVRFKSAGRANQNVTIADVVWLPTLSDGLMDMANLLPTARGDLLPAIADCFMIDGRFVGVPYALDLGLLFYRRDLLERYGYHGPPRTWAELEVMAEDIQSRERAAGKCDFWGFLWQGMPGESLVCCAVEWQHAEGGGMILAPEDGVSANNKSLIKAVQRARSWLGAISPPNLNEYHESRCIWSWRQGNAAFMRQWALSFPFFDEPVVGDLTGWTILPAGSARHAAALGGWPLVVHNAPASFQRALALIDELASLPAQRQRALMRNPYPPSLRVLYDDPELKARTPILQEILSLVESGGLAIRPAKVAGKRYPQLSGAYAKAVAAVLYDDVDAEESMTGLAQTLDALLHT